MNWGTLWTNCQPGWVTGCGLGQNPACTLCEANAKWDAYVPAVFVSDGRVFDVRARYQLTQQCTVAVGIDNVTNQTYWAFHPYTQRTWNAEVGFAF